MTGRTETVQSSHVPTMTRHPAAEQKGKVIAQSVILPGDWSREKCAAWLEEHDYVASGLEESENTWRARQFDPGDFAEGGVEGQDFVVFEIPKSGGVKLVRGRVKDSRTDDRGASRLRFDRFTIDRQEMIGARLRVDGYLSRTGVQEYDQGDGTIQREQRDADEVFKAESLATLRAMPVTVQHPTTEMLDGANWRRLAHGHVGDDVRKAGDGIHTQASIWVLDAETQKKVKAKELAELSVGYFADLDTTPGTNDRGEHYDARQVNIRGNHLALLAAGEARGGPSVRILDGRQVYRLDARGDAMLDATSNPPAAAPDEKRSGLMQLKIKADGYEHVVEAGSDAVVTAIAKDRTAFEAARDAEKARAETVTKERDEVKAKLDAAAEVVAKLEKELAAAKDPAVLTARADARAKLLTDARFVAGKDIKPKGDDGAIKRAALEAAGVKLDGQSDAYIAARFDVARDLAAERAKATDSVSQARRAAVGTPGDGHPAPEPFSIARVQRDALRVSPKGGN